MHFGYPEQTFVSKICIKNWLYYYITILELINIFELIHILSYCHYFTKWCNYETRVLLVWPLIFSGVARIFQGGGGAHRRTWLFNWGQKFSFVQLVHIKHDIFLCPPPPPTPKLCPCLCLNQRGTIYGYSTLEGCITLLAILYGSEWKWLLFRNHRRRRDIIPWH